MKIADVLQVFMKTRKGEIGLQSRQGGGVIEFLSDKQTGKSKGKKK